MGTKKISELTSAGALVGTEVLPLVQSSTTKKVTAQAIADLTVGLPDGGSVGEVLTKLSGTDGDADWASPSAGGSGDLFRRLFKYLYWDGQAEGIIQVGGPVFTVGTNGSNTTMRADPTDAQLLDVYDRQKKTTTNPVAMARWLFATNSEEYFPGHVSGHALAGGFKLEIHFGLRTSFDSDGYAFIGVVEGSQTYTLVGTNPSTFTNVVGIGKDTGDSNLSFMSNDASGAATKTSTGISLATALDKYLIMTVEYVPGAVEYTVTFRIADTGATANTTFSSNIPAIDTMFSPILAVCGGSSTATVEFVKLTIMTPDLTA